MKLLRNSNILDIISLINQTPVLNSSTAESAWILFNSRPKLVAPLTNKGY